MLKRNASSHRTVSLFVRTLDSVNVYQGGDAAWVIHSPSSTARLTNHACPTRKVRDELIEIPKLHFDYCKVSIMQVWKLPVRPSVKMVELDF